MAQDKVIKRRIRSVKNAKQITKALEVVAASRMRRVVGAVEGSRTYANLASRMMNRISGSPEAQNLPYFSTTINGPTLYIVFTSDRGQAGAFNTNVLNLAINQFKEEKQTPQVIVFGRKGARFFAHISGINLIQAYENVDDIPEVNFFAPILESVDKAVASNQLGKVVVVYTQFISSLNQKAVLEQLFPSVENDEENQSAAKVYEFEPELSSVLEEAIRIYIESRLMQAKVESSASEHAMRMVAMNNANRNASDLIDNLTLELNASRQASITQEIAEITAGAAAIAA